MRLCRPRRLAANGSRAAEQAGGAGRRADGGNGVLTGGENGFWSKTLQQSLALPSQNFNTGSSRPECRLSRHHRLCLDSTVELVPVVFWLQWRSCSCLGAAASSTSYAADDVRRALKFVSVSVRDTVQMMAISHCAYICTYRVGRRFWPPTYLQCMYITICCDCRATACNCQALPAHHKDAPRSRCRCTHSSPPDTFSSCLLRTYSVPTQCIHGMYSVRIPGSSPLNLSPPASLHASPSLLPSPPTASPCPRATGQPCLLAHPDLRPRPRRRRRYTLPPPPPPSTKPPRISSPPPRRAPTASFGDSSLPIASAPRASPPIRPLSSPSSAATSTATPPRPGTRPTTRPIAVARTAMPRPPPWAKTSTPSPSSRGQTPRSPSSPMATFPCSKSCARAPTTTTSPVLSRARGGRWLTKASKVPKTEW